MTTLDELDLFSPTTDANPAAPEPRKCRRHQWVGGVCARCSRVFDLELSARNRKSRRRGTGTSAALARYLGGTDVERRGLPWDVEAKGCRIQSKRLATRPSQNAMIRLVQAIEPHIATLRALYLVGPRLKLTSGTVVLLWAEWVAWHGRVFPADAWRVNELFVEMPLRSFRDVHIGIDATGYAATDGTAGV